MPRTRSQTRGVQAGTQQRRNLQSNSRAAVANDLQGVAQSSSGGNLRGTSGRRISRSSNSNHIPNNLHAVENSIARIRETLTQLRRHFEILSDDETAGYNFLTSSPVSGSSSRRNTRTNRVVTNFRHNSLIDAIDTITFLSWHDWNVNAYNNSVNNYIARIEARVRTPNLLNPSSLPSSNPFRCNICSQSYRDREPTAVQCGHVYCRECIERHIENENAVCLVCNATIPRRLLRLFI